MQHYNDVPGAYTSSGHRAASCYTAPQPQQQQHGTYSNKVPSWALPVVDDDEPFAAVVLEPGSSTTSSSSGMSSGYAFSWRERSNRSTTAGRALGGLLTVLTILQRAVRQRRQQQQQRRRQ